MGGGLEAPDRLDAETLVPHEAAETVRLRLEEAGRPTRGSEAWKLAVEWIIARAEGVPKVRKNLEGYCSFELSRRGSFNEQWSWLVLAEDAIRGRAMEGVGLGKRDVSEFRDLLKKRREHDPAYESLTKTIARLDDEGKGDDLLRDVWNVYPEEAKGASLPLVPTSRGGGQGGERPNILVENLVMGDQNTLKDSTAVIRSKVENSFNAKRDDHASKRIEAPSGEPKGVFAWLRDPIVSNVISGLSLILAVILVLIGLG